MEKHKKQKFTLQVSSAPENLLTIREFISDIAINAGFDLESAEQIQLAVDEACTNVIKHAHRYDIQKTVEINVKLDSQKMEINITDSGKGFDVARVAKPDLEKYIHEAKKGGLGIHLMRSLMDEVHFNFNPGKKNQVSLVKFFKKSA